MTEQEYCDLSDLVIFRAVLLQLKMANCFDMPNEQRLKSIKKNLKLMVNHLEPIVSENIDAQGIISMDYYTSKDAGSGQRGICGKCKKCTTKEGHDGCLGTLPGSIMNACCGHGNDSQAYIQYWDKKRICGDEAVAEQYRLIKDT